jgi:hypothetical protein
MVFFFLGLLRRRGRGEDPHLWIGRAQARAPGLVFCPSWRRKQYAAERVTVTAPDDLEQVRDDRSERLEDALTETTDALDLMDAETRQTRQGASERWLIRFVVVARAVAQVELTTQRVPDRLDRPRPSTATTNR